MASGIEAEALNPASQPDEAVAAESEAIESTPLDETTEDEEYVVEVDTADQQEEAKGKKDINWQVMAQKKVELARKRKEQLEKERAEKERLEQELRELKANQLRMQTRKPNPDDYYGDPDGYAKAHAEYEQNSKQLQQLQEQKPTQKAYQVPDEVLAYRYEKEERIKALVPDYEQAESTVREALESAGHNADLIFDQLSDQAYGDDIDFGRMIYGMAKLPDLLQRALTTNSPGVLKRTLKEAESKVKLAKKKPIEAKPEPVINGGGDMSSLEAQEQKLFEEWTDTRSTATYNKLRELRAKRKAAKTA